MPLRNLILNRVYGAQDLSLSSSWLSLSRDDCSDEFLTWKFDGWGQFLILRVNHSIKASWSSQLSGFDLRPLRMMCSDFTHQLVIDGLTFSVDEEGIRIHFMVLKLSLVYSKKAFRALLWGKSHHSVFHHSFQIPTLIDFQPWGMDNSMLPVESSWSEFTEVDEMDWKLKSIHWCWRVGIVVRFRNQENLTTLHLGDVFHHYLEPFWPVSDSSILWSEFMVTILDTVCLSILFGTLSFRQEDGLTSELVLYRSIIDIDALSTYPLFINIASLQQTLTKSPYGKSIERLNSSVHVF